MASAGVWRVMFRPVGLAVLLTACGGATATHAPVAPITRNAAPVRLPAPPAPSASRRPPESVACTWRQKIFGFDIRWSLHAGASGPVYAILAPKTTESKEELFNVVAMLPSDGGDLHVKVSHGGVELEGWVSPSDAPLYARTFMKFGGFVYATGGARLEVQPTAGGLSVLPTDTRRAKLAHIKPRAVSCTDLSLRPGDYESLESLHLPSERTLVDLRHGEVELRLEPGGATVATFDSKPPDDDEAVLVASQGSERRIAWMLGDVWLVGWVSSAVVRPHHADTDDSPASFVTNAPQTPVAVEPPPGLVSVCSRDVRIDAEVGGLRTHVGSVKAGTHIGLGAKLGDAREVNLPPGIGVTPAAKLVASTTELASCTPL